MKLNIFTVYDVKAEAYLPPFFLRSTGEALRAFSACANDPKHNFGATPEDFTLFHVGSMEDRDANFEIFEVKKPLGNALDFKEAPTDG